MGGRIISTSFTYPPSHPSTPTDTQTHAVHVILKEDAYDKNILSSKWVAGPNELFYRVMSRDGDVYLKFIEPGKYRFVQQLETDVCPIRDGWLEALIADAKAASLTASVISGARVESVLLCSAKKDGGDECTPSSAHPEYIRQHINGNALYRMDDRLQDLLDMASERYRPWPFDVAAYLTASATGQLHLLRPTKLIHNRVVPVHTPTAYLADLYDRETHFVHISSNFLRPTQTQAAFATLSRGVAAAIVVGACQHTPLSILANLHRSLQRAGVRNVLWSAQGDGVAKHVQSLRPLAFVGSKERYPHPSSSDPGCIPPFDVIEQLVSLEHNVFYLDGNAVITGDVVATLEERLDGNEVYVASGAVQSYGHYYEREPHSPRYKFSSKAFYMPAKAGSLRLIQAWRIAMSVAPHADADAALNAGVRCASMASCAWDETPVRLLPPDQFVSGPNLVKQWPSSSAVEQAVALIDVGSPSTSNDGLSSEDHMRFRLQHLKKWLLPRQNTCCESVLIADDVNVGENATTVLQYVDLLLRMNRTATQANIRCIVPPVVFDARTGERMTYEVFLDPTAIFRGSHVYPSMSDAPLCPQFDGRRSNIINASTISTDFGTGGWRAWPLDVFTLELRDAFNTIVASPVLSSAICLDESERPLAEAALHLLRGSARALVQSSAASSNASIYVMGKWRVLNAHVHGVVPNALTLLSPILYPGSTPTAMYTAFGLRAQYPRLGEDLVMDVLDALVCRLASNITSSQVPALETSELYAGLLEFVDPDVLEEELRLLQIHIAKMEAAPRIPPQPLGAPPIVPPTYLIPLDELANNGFSNTVQAAQVLAYVANKTGLNAAMVPFSIRHRRHSPRPWSDVVANVTSFYNEINTLTPPIWAMLRHPSLLVEVMEGYMLPAGPAKLWSHNATCRQVRTQRGEVVRLPCMTANDVWNKISSAYYSPRLFQRLHITRNAAERERLLLRGHDAVVGSTRAYLGLSDEEVSSVIAARTTFRGRDILFRPFRAFNFQNTNPNHLEFAKSWRAAFKPAASLVARVDATLSSLAVNFSCYHARVAEEFMAQHRADRPQFGAETVFKIISERIQQGHDTSRPPDPSKPTAYISSDLAEPTNHLSYYSSMVATSCHAFGCSEKDEVGWGIVDRLVCASAAKFLGNIYSTFTLSVCALRNDQKCRDLFGQALGDDRLLF